MKNVVSFSLEFPLFPFSLSLSRTRTNTHVRTNRNINIPGTQVVPVPLFHALDGKTTNDYVARVEPSSQGGRKMAEYILDMIDDGQIQSGGGVRNNYDATSSSRYGSTTSTPLQASYMEDRG